MALTLALTIPEIKLEINSKQFTLKEMPASKQASLRELRVAVGKASDGLSAEADEDQFEIAEKIRSATVDLICFILDTLDREWVTNAVLPYGSLVNRILKTQDDLNTPEESGLGNFLRLLPQRA